jgi:hypothetical protein
MDCHDSKLNGTVFGTHDWPYHLRGQAAMYRKLAEQTDDPTVKNELLELASVCEEADAPDRQGQPQQEGCAERGVALS